MFDEQKPLFSLKSEIAFLRALDKTFQEGSPRIRSSFNRLHPILKDKYPVPAGTSFLVDRHTCLPATSIIRSIFEAETEILEGSSWAQKKYGATSRAQLAEKLADVYKGGLPTAEDRYYTEM